MSLQLVTSNYSGNQITFTEEGWFNATEAAARFGKEPAQWMRLPATVEYLEALKRKYGKITYYKTKRGKTGGTWLHPKLAVRFAQWLDIDFAVWCDEQIDSIIRGQHQYFDWKRIRSEATSTHKVMAAVLQYARNDQGKETQSHHYSNESRLVNWAATGEFKKQDRDRLSFDELNLLAKLEERNAVLIGRGLDYHARKTILHQLALDIKAGPLRLAA